MPVISILEGGDGGLQDRVLTLNKGGVSRWGGDSHRRNMDGGLACLSDISLVVRVLCAARQTFCPLRVLLWGDSQGLPPRVSKPFPRANIDSNSHVGIHYIIKVIRKSV